MRSKKKHIQKKQIQRTTKNRPVIVSAEIQTTVAVRALAKEASRIVTDSDWNDMKNSVKSLDSFNNEYSEWSRALFSVSVSFFIFCVTLLIQDIEVIKKWYVYPFIGVTFLSLIGAIILMRKGDEIKNNIRINKNTLNQIITRIEGKSEGLNIDYSRSVEDSTPL